MRITGLGQILLGLSFAAIGALSMGFHDFAVAWELLPKWLAGRDAHHVPDILCGALLFLGGVGLLVPRMAKPASFCLPAFCFCACCSCMCRALRAIRSWRACGNR